MEHKNKISAIPQYSLGKILLIWAAAAIPMGILSWIILPAVSPDFGLAINRSGKKKMPIDRIE